MMAICVVAVVSLSSPADAIAAVSSAPCYSTLIPGYSVPLCNRKIQSKIKFGYGNFGVFDLRTSDPYQKKHPSYQWKTKPDKANGIDGVAYTQEDMNSMSKKNGGDAVYQIPKKMSDYGNAHLFADFQAMTPTHCALACDAVKECTGFSYKFMQCIFSENNAGLMRMGNNYKWSSQEFTTYWKSGSPARTSSKLVGQPSSDTIYQFPGLARFKSSVNCDVYFSLGEPCTHDAIAVGTSFTSDDRFDDLSSWDTLMPLDDGQDGTWKGAAPGAFDASKATSNDALVLETEHHDPAGSFTMPTSDEDCGCTFDTYVTSMVSAKTAVGYGVYEATLKSTASEFVNAFWMQGDTAEINVLKVEDGVASVSWFCFADQANQVTKSYNVSGVDLSKDTTATLSWNQDMFTVLINGKIAVQEETHACLKDIVMKPIFSVEVGDKLPATDGVAAGASFGKMTVNYFRSWSATSLHKGNGKPSKTKVTDENGISFYDRSQIEYECKGKVRSTDKATGPDARRMGLYQGPVPAGKWTAVCGMRLMASRKIIGRQSKAVNIPACGQLCDDTPGCTIFQYANNKNCLLFTDDVTSKYDVDVEDKTVNGRLVLENNVVFYRDVQYVKEGVDNSDNGDWAGYPGMLIPKANPAKPVECPTTAIAGMTVQCFARPAALGKLAGIDFDEDGVLDYGCPYAKTEIFKTTGQRNSKACSSKDCKDGVNDCPTKLVGANTGDEYIMKSALKRTTWEAKGFHTKDWHGQGALGEMTSEVCVKICKESCSCMAAGWWPVSGTCRLMATDTYRKEKSQVPRTRAPMWVADAHLFIKDMDHSENNYCDMNVFKAKSPPWAISSFKVTTPQ
jgi:hypothetical protein